MTKIYLKESLICGSIKVCPVCDKSKEMAALAGTKCLSPSAIKRILKQGYEVEIQKLGEQK